jgi:hypothetical protein
MATTRVLNFCSGVFSKFFSHSAPAAAMLHLVLHRRRRPQLHGCELQVRRKLDLSLKS